MLQHVIIEKFRNGELKPCQTFAKYLDPPSHMRVAYVALRVGINGDSLTCTWYDRNRRIISNQWTIWKDNINTDGYSEVSSDWDRAWRTHEDNFS